MHRLQQHVMRVTLEVLGEAVAEKSLHRLHGQRGVACYLGGFARPGENPGPHGPVGLGGFKGLGQLREHPGRDRVAPVRAIQPDRRHVALDSVENFRL